MTEEVAPHTTSRKKIIISVSNFAFGNIEAWINIIASYKEKHPNHHVLIYYEGLLVMNMIALFKMVSTPNREGFTFAVQAPDKNIKDVPRLYRFLVEGASDNFHPFIGKEIYKTLELF